MLGFVTLRSNRAIMMPHHIDILWYWSLASPRSVVGLERDSTNPGRHDPQGPMLWFQDLNNKQSITVNSSRWDSKIGLGGSALVPRSSAPALKSLSQDYGMLLELGKRKAHFLQWCGMRLLPNLCPGCGPCIINPAARCALYH